MKNSEKQLNDCIAMAIEHYTDARKPEVFATAAALTIARAAATEFSPESANAAAYIAAVESATSMIDFAQLLTDLENQNIATQAAMKNSRAKSSEPNSSEPITPPVKSFFEALAEQQQPVSPLDMRKLYNETYNTKTNENHRAALNAACAHYAHAYASTYSAYVHAIAVTARVSNKKERVNAFVAAIKKRLNADLNHQPLEPSFFMDILCSDISKIIGVIVLVAGLIALGLAIGALVTPAVGAAITTAGLTEVSMGSAGMALMLSGVGLFAMRAITMRQWAQENDMSRKAVEAVNTYA